jgi:hypothetical protein
LAFSTDFMAHKPETTVITDQTIIAHQNPSAFEDLAALLNTYLDG